MNKQLIKKFKKYDDTFVNRPKGNRRKILFDCR